MGYICKSRKERIAFWVMNVLHANSVYFEKLGVPCNLEDRGSFDLETFSSSIASVHGDREV
jgi:hypothetical protein